MRRALALTAAIALAGCVHRGDPAPADPPDARSGHAPHDFDRERACTDWRGVFGPLDPSALRHVSLPTSAPPGCFVQVHYDGEKPRPDPTPEGCGYPGSRGVAERLEREASRYRAIAEGLAAPLPRVLACSLPDDVRRAAARVNATTMQRLADESDPAHTTPYSAVAAFGFGWPAEDHAGLTDWRPGQTCPKLGKRQMDLLGVNVVRAGRAAAAFHAHVGPVVVVSGGAVHSNVVEAFLLDYLLTCRFGVRPDRVLLDPCADHTHTNARNVGSLVVALGGRTAYVVTDDGFQADYLQDSTLFQLVGGSIDQRSLRDFGYLVGSYRQASVGIDAGFWLTPYRFWAEPPGSKGAFTCD
jgi:hypothetical protein